MFFAREKKIFTHVWSVAVVRHSNDSPNAEQKWSDVWTKEQHDHGGHTEKPDKVKSQKL